LVDLVKDDYGIASEHAHSCCVLAAKKTFLIDDIWNTCTFSISLRTCSERVLKKSKRIGIDYEKFFDLLESGVEFGKFSSMIPIRVLSADNIFGLW
jgi:tRNA wybutosine-synthesizing protein 1